MQTPAQCRLVAVTAQYLRESVKGPARLLNMGAGKSVVLERSLAERGCSFICDRLDVDDCAADHPNVGSCYQCSAEHMAPLQSGAYDLVFSNYVLEHIEDLDSAIAEIHRILKPGGLCVSSIPNPRSPEFAVARRTPLWFHRFVRGGTGWHTHYSYESIRALSERFQRAGLETVDIAHYPFIRQYLSRFFLLKWIGALYDTLVGLIGWKALMGNVCFVARKVGGKEAPEMRQPDSDASAVSA